MTAQTVAEIIRQALMTAFWTCLPLLAIGLVAGVVVSFVQIVTSIQDPGFAAIPRMVVFLLALVFLLPWMLARLMQYATGVMGELHRHAR